mgnify:CR=1 FL=1
MAEVELTRNGAVATLILNRPYVGFFTTFMQRLKQATVGNVDDRPFLPAGSPTGNVIVR